MNDKTLYVYEVTKDDLNHQSTDRFLGIVDRLKEDGTRFRSSLTITCGVYNDTADELYAIPKFRKWIRKVVKLRPSLFYFLSLGMDYIHVLGCLGDISTVTTETPLSIDEMEKRGILPSKAMSHILLDEEYYELLKRGIQNFCEEVGDPIAEAELLAFLEYHHKDEEVK